MSRGNRPSGQQKAITPSAQPPAPTQTTISWEGPLPPPALLAQYNNVFPGGADRIVKMLEDQVAHRIDMEKSVINAEIGRAYLGIGAGLLIAIVGLAVSTLVIMSGHDTVGGILGGTTIVSLVGTFVYGTNSRKKERTEKAKIMAGLDTPRKPPV